MLGANELGKQVSGVHLTLDLSQFNLPVAHTLLYPQRVCLYMPEFAQPSPIAYTYGRAAVHPHTGREWDTKIGHGRPMSNSNARGFDYTVILSLP